MNNKQEKICRLCLKMSNSEFAVINEVTQDILSTILIKVNLSISDEPAMCKNCAESLQKSFDFKSACMSAEGCLTSFAVAKGGATLDLRDVYLVESTNIINVNDVDGSICRFCIQRVRKGCYTSLDTLEKAMGIMTDLLPKYIPEINLNLTKEPIICTPCLASLECHFSFAMACWKAEGKIKKFLETEGTNGDGQIKLIDVLHFSLLYLLENENDDDHIYVDVIKKDHLFDIQEDVKEELLMKIERPDVKEEKIESSLQQTIPNSFQTGTASNCELIKFGHEDNQKAVHVGLPEAITYKCELCLVGTELEHHLDLHLPTHRTSPKKCVQANASDITYKCEKCTYKTKRKCHLKDHMVTHKDPSEIPMYKCESCSYQTRKKYDIKRHTLTHRDPSELTMYKCEVCPYETKQKFHLKVHGLTHKDPSEITMYKCNSCSYQTRRKYRLKDHMVRHMDPAQIPMYKCEVCTFKTKQKFCLRRHMLMHENHSQGDPFKCQLCSFESRKKSCLDKHMFVHKDPSQAKMYKCDTCSYEAKRKSRLKDHMLTHKDPSEIAMFKCEVCSFETKKKFSLKRHMLIHRRLSEVTAYTCDSCPYESKNRSDVRGHLLTHGAC